MENTCYHIKLLILLSIYALRSSESAPGILVHHPDYFLGPLRTHCARRHEKWEQAKLKSWRDSAFMIYS